MSRDNPKDEILESTLHFMKSSHSFSRREFLLMTGGIVIAISALEAKGAKEAPLIIMDQAKGLVIADPTKCVGCRRCELACTEFNDGKASPTMARIKISSEPQFWTKRPPRAGSAAKVIGETAWSFRISANNVLILCLVRTPARMTQSL